jgi:NADH dehydrogenase (ubiquinone) Fe-S protein 6
MLLRLPRRRLLQSALRPGNTTAIRTYAENPKATTLPSSGKPTKPNVSGTNEVATSSIGTEDASVVESVAEGEKMRTMQAPNRQGVWSRSQQPREKAMVGPRFEQTIIADQV